MKRGTHKHPKVKALAKTLGIPVYAALGLLDTLWDMVGQYAPAGNIGKFSDEHIASEIGWEGDCAKLFNALTSEVHRWLDPHPEHRLIVHDWPDHCEDWVHIKLARATQLFADGSMPKLGRFAKVEREHIESAFKRLKKVRTANARRTHGERSANALPCLALPSLALALPSQEKTHTPAVAGESDSAVAAEVARRNGKHTQSQVEALYQAYPRHEQPQAAFKAISKAIKLLAQRMDDPQGYLLARVHLFAKLCRGKERRFIPHPATWFNRGGYDSDMEQPPDEPADWIDEGTPSDPSVYARQPGDPC